MFKKGDIFTFNSSGVELFRHISGKVGIIASEPVRIFEYDFGKEKGQTDYNVYDIIVCGQLFMDIPEEFLLRVVQLNEKNVE